METKHYPWMKAVTVNQERSRFPLCSAPRWRGNLGITACCQRGAEMFPGTAQDRRQEPENLIQCSFGPPAFWEYEHLGLS